MKIRVDESGDFAFSADGPTRYCVIAGLVIPDRSWAVVGRFVEDRKQAWGMDRELKGGDMNDEQLLQIAEFISGEGLATCMIAADSEMFPAAAQHEWRHRLTETFRAAADRSQRAAKEKTPADRVARTRTRIHRERHVSAAGFLQYQVLMPWLLNQLMSAANFRYSELPAARDSWVFDIILDAREGADPGKSGDLLRDTIEAILVGHDAFSLYVPSTWPPTHPFIVRNTDPEVGLISARQTLAAGINHGHSHEDPGLQLADVVAHLLHTLLREPSEPGATHAWSALYEAIIPTADGWPVKVWAWGDDVDVNRMDLSRHEELVLPGRTKTWPGYPTNVTVREFSTGDDWAYVDWTASTPNGYVLRIARSHNPRDARMHRATCHTIRGDPRLGQSWTRGSVKVCAQDWRALDDWALANAGQRIERCQICRPPL